MHQGLGVPWHACAARTHACPPSLLPSPHPPPSLCVPAEVVQLVWLTGAVMVVNKTVRQQAAQRSNVQVAQVRAGARAVWACCAGVGRMERGGEGGRMFVLAMGQVCCATGTS